MGKSYSYSIVVEQGGALLINDQEIPLPAEVSAAGDDPLGWALDQVRAAYASKYSQNEDSELNLSVRDRRPGGLVRRAKFTHPDSGIDLETFLGNRRRTHRVEDAGRPEAPVEPEPLLPPAQAEEPKSMPGEVEDATTDTGDHSSVPSARSATTTEDEPVPAPTRAARRRERRKKDQPVAAATVTDSEPSRTGKAVARNASQATAAVATIPPEEATSPEQSYEDRVRTERGWKKLPKDKSSRPQVGSAENEGRSKKLGLLAEAQKQKTLRVVGIVVVVVLVIVGFRLFNGGTEYEALCVDQRTMTRTVTGAACENDADTNHRWWFTAEVESLPAPGDSINTQQGTFDEPNGDKDTINWNLESAEADG